MVEISVTDNMTPALKNMMAGCEDMKVPLARAGLYMFKSFMLQFAARGIPKWKALSPITIAHRRNFSDAPLLDTGRLRRSYVSRGGEGKWSLSNFQLDIGSNLDYAELHQFGGTTMLHEKSWFKSGRKGKPDIDVGMPPVNAKGLPKRGYKLKFIKSYIKIKVPARPLAILPVDIQNIAIIFGQYLQGLAKK